MNFTTMSISAAPYIALSASYRYDSKIDLQPTLFQYDEGYSFFHHPVFLGTKDVHFSNESFFTISSATSLASIINDTVYIDPTELVLFTGIRASNGKYVSNVNNTLYAIATSIGDSEFFRVIRNSNGTYSISQNNLYATVITDDNDLRVNMESKLEYDINNIQNFMIYSGDNSNTFTIKTRYTMSTWAPYFTKPVERFWSFYDSNGTNMIKTIGLIKDDDYVYENDYRFTASVNTQTNAGNLQTFAIGYNGNIIWVKYYNDLYNKFFNKSVDVKDYIENVKMNYLVEYPYKTKIDITNYDALLKTGEIKVNMINLKNIMTPEYNYNVKKE